MSYREVSGGLSLPVSSITKTFTATRILSAETRGIRAPATRNSSPRLVRRELKARFDLENYECKAWFVPGKTAEHRVNRWLAREAEQVSVYADSKGPDAFDFDPIDVLISKLRRRSADPHALLSDGPCRCEKCRGHIGTTRFGHGEYRSGLTSNSAAVGRQSRRPRDELDECALYQ